MKHNKITVVSISDPTGTMTPSAGANGELGPLALLSQVKAVSADNLSQQNTLAALTSLTGSSGSTLVAAVSAGLDTRIVALENGGKIFSGQITLNTSTNLYSVSHITITGSSYPLITVVAPSSNSILYAESVTNVSVSGFDVALSSIPATSGYKLNWQRASSGTATVYYVSSTAPALSSSDGNFKDIAIDTNYIYVCVATNTWKRAALSPW